MFSQFSFLKTIAAISSGAKVGLKSSHGFVTLCDPKWSHSKATCLFGSFCPTQIKVDSNYYHTAKSFGQTHLNLNRMSFFLLFRIQFEEWQLITSSVLVWYTIEESLTKLMRYFSLIVKKRLFSMVDSILPWSYSIKMSLPVQIV